MEIYRAVAELPPTRMWEDIDDRRSPETVRQRSHLGRLNLAGKRRRRLTG